MGFWKWFEKRYARPDDPLPEKADAVIAIGIDVAQYGIAPSPQSAAVAQKATEYFLSYSNGESCGKAILILTGGYRRKDQPDVTEAMMMHWALTLDSYERFAYKRDIILEEKSRRTYGNADNVLPILQELNLRNVVIVAQQWHARRVAATFKKRWAHTGIEFAVVKAWSEYGGGSQRRLNNFFFFLCWDTLAFIVSKIKGYC